MRVKTETIIYFILLNCVGISMLFAQSKGGLVQPATKQCYTDKKTYTLYEPVKLYIEYVNNDDKKNSYYLPMFAAPLYVNKAYLNKWELCIPYFYSQERGERMRVDASTPDPYIVKRIDLEVGETFTTSSWILLGVSEYENVFKGEQYIFDREGTYLISKEEDGSNSIEINIIAQSKADKKAVETYWTKETVQIVLEFLNDVPDINAKEKVKILRKKVKGVNLNESVYGAYMATAIAKGLSHTGKFDDDPEDNKEKIDFEEYKRYLNVVIENHKDSPLYEDALYLMMEGYGCQSRGKVNHKKSAADYGRELLSKYPNTKYLNRVISRIENYEDQLKIKSAPKMKKTGIAKITYGNLEKIPSVPKTVFREYFECLQKKEIDNALKYIADDYVCSKINRPNKKRWHKTMEREINETLYIEEFHIEVLSCDSIAENNANACIIKTTLSGIEYSIGQEKEEFLSSCEWILKEIDEKWFIISEKYE